MATRLALRLFLLLLPLLIACSRKKPPVVAGPASEGHNLIPIDYTDPYYADFSLRYTLTADGWSIRHLVRNTTTRHQELYIWWGKGSTGIYETNTLQLRPDFTPHYAGENAQHLFLTYRCMTECCTGRCSVSVF